MTETSVLGPPLYTDPFIDVFEDHMIFKGYYFLRFGQKRIEFSQVEKFKEVRLTYFNGMSRHESNWWEPRWPFDWKVKTRKEAFLIKSKGKRFGIGFSAENTREVAMIIHKRINVS